MFELVLACRSYDCIGKSMHANLEECRSLPLGSVPIITARWLYRHVSLDGIAIYFSTNILGKTNSMPLRPLYLT